MSTKISISSLIQNSVSFLQQDTKKETGIQPASFPLESCEVRFYRLRRFINR
jgi:hypothetical protein